MILTWPQVAWHDTETVYHVEPRWCTFMATLDTDTGLMSVSDMKRHDTRQQAIDYAREHMA